MALISACTYHYTPPSISESQANNNLLDYEIISDASDMGNLRKFDWKLDSKAITQKIMERANAYSEHYPAYAAESKKTIYMALADITGDNSPEVFIGFAEFLTGVQYSAYTQNLEHLPIGEISDDADHVFSFPNNYLPREQGGETGDFLFGKVFYNKAHDTHYYIARGWNGRIGAPSEVFVFSCFWFKDREWHNALYRWSWDDLMREGKERFVVNGFDDPYSKIAVAEQIVSDGSENMNFDSIQSNVIECIRQYNENADALGLKN